MRIEDAAELLGVNPRSVRNYVARGVIAGYRIRGSRLLRVDAAEVEALLEQIPTARSRV